MSQIKLVNAYFYTHQTSATCAGKYVCYCTHQAEKTCQTGGEHHSCSSKSGVIFFLWWKKNNISIFAYVRKIYLGKIPMLIYFSLAPPILS